MAWSKLSRHARGYGRDWEKLRLLILMRDQYLCQCPQCLGGELRVTPANEVDHITPKARGGTDDEQNLRAINTVCHRRVTLEQQGKTTAQRRRIGLDGFPIDDGGG